MSLGPAHLEVLAFLLGDCLRVLLVRSDDDGWTLPSGPMIDGLTQHESVALGVKSTLGVAGRIFKCPLRTIQDGRRVSVFPLLAREPSDTRGEFADGAAARWFPAGEALVRLRPERCATLKRFIERAARRWPEVGPDGDRRAKRKTPRSASAKK